MRRVVWLVTFFPLCLGAAPFEREVPENRDGVAKYDEKRYDEAGEAFKKGAERRAESPEIDYNLGAALFKKGDLDGARRAWESALAKNPDPALRARIYDGFGSVAAARQNYAEAARFFDQALRIHPDRDTAANLEIVRRLLKQQEEQQPKPQQQEQQQNQRQDQRPEEKEQKQQGQEKKPQDDRRAEEQKEEDKAPGPQEKKEQQEQSAARAQKDEKEQKEPQDAAAVLAPFRKRKDLQVTPFMLERQGEPQGGQIW